LGTPVAEYFGALIMAALSSLLGHGHDPVLRAGHRPAHEQQIPLRIHLDHREPELRVALGAMVPRHLLALDDARRIRAGPDRAGLAVARVAVRGRTTAEAVPVHHALE